MNWLTVGCVCASARLQDLADQMRAKLEIRDRRYHLTTYNKW